MLWFIRSAKTHFASDSHLVLTRLKLDVESLRHEVCDFATTTTRRLIEVTLEILIKVNSFASLYTL